MTARIWGVGPLHRQSPPQRQPPSKPGGWHSPLNVVTATNARDGAAAAKSGVARRWRQQEKKGNRDDGEGERGQSSQHP